MSAVVSNDLQTRCINVIRGLAMDAVERAKSGHPGMPMGCAPMATVLWTKHLRHNPNNPKWFNRDRFILSAGHGSMLLYSLLHLTGYDLTLDDIKAFRQLHSKTPGHPENFATPGVEMATGPLGQGLATSVGMAIAEEHLRAVYGEAACSHYTYVIASDGDLMEGVAQEACSLAGHLALGRLIVLYDDNGITIDGNTALAFTENTAAKFEAMGWHVQKIDGMDAQAVDQALSSAKQVTDKPSLICARTIIGFGSPNKANSPKSHGSPLGAEELALTKAALGLPNEEFWIPEDVLNEFRAAVAKGDEWEAAWRASAPPSFLAMLEQSPTTDWISNFPTGMEPVATRASNGIALQLAAAQCHVIGGSADLTHNVMTEIKDGGTFSPANRRGRNINFGVREHAMAAAANGLTLHGPTRGMAGTFFIFSDYCRPSLRLAALMECPTIFCFSHDSIGLGEDGPTHQPIEQLAACRAIPNFNTFRPADASETAVAWAVATQSTKVPTAIITSRQSVPNVTPQASADHPAFKGGYVLVDAPSPKVCLVATGSEVGLALSAAKLLEQGGVSTRVVSLPSWYLFELQPDSYRNHVLPKDLPTVSVEAGSTMGWSKYAQAHVGLDHFGASAPANDIFQAFGFTPQNVAAQAIGLLNKK
ncbi:MAG: transketolase [Fimbriimonadaceae bacterium]|nr:transketolase [Fimbriimonadaceae bacterium]